MTAATTASNPVAVRPAAGRSIGRFQLLRQLGRGAQASVWLAHDPRLQREVALKLLDRNAEADTVSRWMREAHAVSRLNHPNIVPVFEADDVQGQPCLVFEFVDGGTLADHVREHGALGPHKAVELMDGVLDALAAAHRQGIVHRDLKPTNVLMGRDGRPRVMDFGIAAWVSGEADGLIVGTPGYLSPEAARGEAPSPRMDVFAAGVMLAELISGQRLLLDTDPMRALARVQAEDLALPAGAVVDDILRSIVQRAVSRDPAHRYATAAELRDALQTWRKAEAPAGDADTAATGSGTLDFLLRRMRHKADFPALGEAVVRIQRSASSETDSLGTLASEILRDVALTNKLLRLVNSAQFRHASGGSVSTVTRAVALVGFAGVRNLALSLVLLEHMGNRQHATQLKEEFLRALMAGTLAGALAPLARESEEVFIGALFQNLGRLLTEFYFPEEALQIRALRDSGVAPEDAARRVLGIGWQDLAVGVARVWGLPEHLQKLMRQPDGALPSRAIDRGIERQRWMGRCANELTDCLLSHGPEDSKAAVAALAERHARTLGLSTDEIVHAAGEARERLVDFARSLGVDVARGSATRRLFPVGATLSGGPEEEPTLVDITAPEVPSPELVTAALTAGIADVTQSLASDEFKLNDLLRMVLETMHRALGLQRIVLCLRDPKTDSLVGRLALGAGSPTVARAIVVPLHDAPGSPVDLFGAVCRKGVDTVISDTTRGGMASRLPAWYVNGVNAPSFLLLPLTMRHAPFGLIYADAARPGALAPQERELALLRALRNQVVMAFRQTHA